MQGSTSNSEASLRGPTPPSPNGKNKCPLTHKCLLCTHEAPACITVKNPTWPAIMRVVLYTLAVNSPSKRYFGLKHDIYPFIDSHWSVLCTGKSSNWHKPMQDALSHGLNLFVSGRNRHGTGFWGLKVYTNPWFSTDNGTDDTGGDNETHIGNQFNSSLSGNNDRKRKRGHDSIPNGERAAILGEIQSLRKSMNEMETKLIGIKDDLELHKTETNSSIERFNLDHECAEREVRELKDLYKSASRI